MPDTTLTWRPRWDLRHQCELCERRAASGLHVATRYARAVHQHAGFLHGTPSGNLARVPAIFERGRPAGFLLPEAAEEADVILEFPAASATGGTFGQPEPWEDGYPGWSGPEIAPRHCLTRNPRGYATWTRSEG